MKVLMLVVVTSLTLTACDSGKNLAELCKENSEICYEFKEDNYCKKERFQTVVSGISLKNTPEGKQQYDMLIAYEQYAECMNLASQIEHIKLKEKKSLRVENYLIAKEKIKALSKETLHSEHPHLLYFHWSRYLNEIALQKFIKMEGSAALENPESQLNLATYYSKRDQEKTLSLLFHALELYTADDELNPVIFKSLSTIFTDKQKHKQAYIWLKVLMLTSPDDVDFSKKNLIEYRDAYQLNGDFLNQVAEKTLDNIKQGKFKTPNF